MKGRRRQHSADLKAKVAISAIHGVSTVQEIASRYEIHPTLVAKWKKEALDGLPEIFARGPDKSKREEQRLCEQLYEQIGRLKVENDWLKKKSDLLD